ncbi:MAG: orotidine-5'-phosphate decarboxylase [Peptococcaceae bacterium]
MKEKLIVALDKPDFAAAQKLIDRLGDTVVFYKVGLELFLNSRGAVIDYLKQQNRKIFLDLKFHDIPNTVAQAAKWAAGLGVDIFNVHAAGGADMLCKTVEAVKDITAQKGLPRPKVIGVTVLTSFSEEKFAQMGFKYSVNDTVVNWGRLCRKSGLDGVVCSAREAAFLKKACGDDFLTVCPGIRPLWAPAQDQKRITTPQEAIAGGADYIVVGRPITQHADPDLAAQKVMMEMEEIK